MIDISTKFARGEEPHPSQFDIREGNHSWSSSGDGRVIITYPRGAYASWGSWNSPSYSDNAGSLSGGESNRSLAMQDILCKAETYRSEIAQYGKVIPSFTQWNGVTQASPIEKYLRKAEAQEAMWALLPSRIRGGGARLPTTVPRGYSGMVAAPSIFGRGGMVPADIGLTPNSCVACTFFQLGEAGAAQRALNANKADFMIGVRREDIVGILKREGLESDKYGAIVNGQIDLRGYIALERLGPGESIGISMPGHFDVLRGPVTPSTLLPENAEFFQLTRVKR